MNIINYTIDDTHHKKLCRIVYGLAYAGYSIDIFIDDYTSYYHGKIDKRYFVSRYSFLVDRVGYDAFIILNRRGLSTQDFNYICSKIRRLYEAYAQRLSAQTDKNNVPHRQ